MGKKIFKFITIGTTVLTITLNTITVNANSGSMGMQFLKKYNSNEIILLKDKPIQIPMYVKEQENQLRGVWVSTVFNLDFPAKKGLTELEYKNEYIRLLDNLEALNMNTVIFQVRPKLDAFYKSNINPWSEYLTGKQGLSPSWDPLKWMIEETHKRGMEFHAWFNPYRVTTGAEKISDLAPNNWARQNPQYTFSFNGKLQLNPGEPEVIKHINDSVMEVVEHYDIDAVHFDDYFYPFKSGNSWYAKEEENSFKKYGTGFKSRDEWRRNNVDMLIETIHNSIEAYNIKNEKSVQFGISPFGIWGHKEFHPEGSIEGIGSQTPKTSRASYDDQFADTRKWVKSNWIDYIAPQIYWTFDEKAAPYGELVNWWADVVRDTDVNLYIGHANYRKADINNKNLSWKNPEEISNQLKFNSLYDEVKGSIFFRYKSLLENEKNPPANNQFIKILKGQHFNTRALLPSKPLLNRKDI
ncbi:family 10 glycosylhydrolase [Tissierella sp.]|uniref:glycoside hydrolase family 10 protein n=1 Tax=Tissierella sp. TaxID=41274 RepID=UPI0028A640F6|nr:family 10 glycosylhydrolase [Tissierella sp.]